jgi:hypothetical protein
MVKDLNTTISIKGMSGVNYIFNVYGFSKFSDLRDAFKGFPALYAFTRRLSHNHTYRHKLIFVGETEDLSSKFIDYPMNPCLDCNNANCICIHSFRGSTQERIAVEEDILNAFDLLNK